MFPSLLSWAISLALNSGNSKRVEIPYKESIKCGALIFVSSFSFAKALYFGSYPGLLMMKSFNIMPLALASMITGKEQRNSTIKLVAGALSLGVIFLFAFGRPNSSP